MRWMGRSISENSNSIQIEHEIGRRVGGELSISGMLGWGIGIRQVSVEPQEPGWQVGQTPEWTEQRKVS